VGVDAVVPAFLIIVLGGVGSLWGAVIAGLMVGMVVGLTGFLCVRMVADVHVLVVHRRGDFPL
jgi:branched-subunit amino acid ABC-type transport system permease component